MGTTTFIVMSALKIGAVMGVGLGVTTAFQYFHNFKFKPKKKEKGGVSDVSISEDFREKARRIG